MNSWQITRIDQCARIVGGSTPKTSVKDYWDGEIYWATPKDLSNLESPNLEGTPRKITKAGLDSCGAEVLPEGSVLFSSRAPIGHVAINCVPMATNQGFKSFVPDPEKLDSKFLYYWLRKNRAYFNSLGNGATFKEVSKAIVSRIEIPLPPLVQQKRIAAILDKAEELRGLRRQALGELDAITQSIFLEMFGDPEKNPKGWAILPLSNFVNEFRYGSSNKSQSHGKPALRIPNVIGGTLDLSDLKVVPVDHSEFERLQMRDGDLLFVRTNGNPDFVGRCAVFDYRLVASTGFQADEFIFASYLIRARLTLDSIVPIFLRKLLLGSCGRRELRSRCKTSAGQFKINIPSLSAIPVPVPPLTLQQEFARRVEAIEQLKATHRESLAHLDALFASLQHRAFRGEL